jgi:ribonuclease HI
MSLPAPHYLLFSHSRGGPQGDWRFVLRSVTGSEQLEVADQEPSVQGERLELLAVVRGLESLDQPSKVTLMTPSKYVREGIRFGLSEWRDNGWRWESFGEMVPVKNRDLWQRVDRAMWFHEVDCRTWRLDAPHVGSSPQENAPSGGARGRADRRASDPPEVRGWRGRLLEWGCRVAAMFRRWRSEPVRWWTPLAQGP